MFVGRKRELELLLQLQQKNTSSLVCVLGRRRIGKSTLIEHFSKPFRHFVNIQGLAPGKGINNQTQLDHFSRRLAAHFKKEPLLFTDWSTALSKLADYSQGKEILILLDEISWMGKYDPAFSAQLKDVWDTAFKKNPQLILVVCGSVSTWIEDNILKNTSFEGRISLEINLGELSLPEVNQFWTKKHLKVSSFEKMTILSVTGGVPKYLEEILETTTAEKNLMRLCFSKEGILFNDFGKIFTEIFGRRSVLLEKMIRNILLAHLSPAELAAKMKHSQNKEFTDCLHILELSGFLSRDFYYKPNGEISKFSKLRVKDNYLRFYIKHIEPMRDRIMTSSVSIKSFKDLKGIENLFGYQFENLILANRQLIHSLLGLEDSDIVSSAPYKQNETKSNSGGCQIDLLIAAKFDSFFLCEMKCQKSIDKSVILEVEKKSEVLKLPQRSSLRPVLIYEGELYPPHLAEIENYFFRIIHFSELLESN